MPTEKYMGFDVELGTSGVLPDGRAIDNWHVTGMVLDALEEALEPHGVKVWSRRSMWGGPGRYSTDWNRHWLSNAVSCIYGDLGHVELASASTKYPRQFAAQLVAGMEIAEAARRIAEAEAPEGTALTLSAHNCDAHDASISWGHHTNSSVDDDLWEVLFEDPRRPAVLGFVSSGMAAAAAFFGSGNLLKLRNGGRRYVLSSRSPHLTKMITRDTTHAYRRGILNSRHEAHAEDVERLHTICMDASPLSAALRCCFVQCLLSAAEHGFAGMNLFDPVQALRTFSFDFDVQAGRCRGSAQVVDGRQLTLPQYVGELAKVLLEMVEGGLIDEETVPQAGELLPQVIELAEQVDCGELGAAARHLDWAAKLLLLLDTCDRHRCDFTDPRAVLVDQDFHNTDPEASAFFQLWQDGVVDPLITREDVTRALTLPPEESRDWARGKLIEKFAGDEEHGEILRVEWDAIELGRFGRSWTRRLKIDLPTLSSCDRASFEPLLAAAETVDDLERLLEEQSDEDEADEEASGGQSPPLLPAARPGNGGASLN